MSSHDPREIPYNRPDELNMRRLLMRSMSRLWWMDNTAAKTHHDSHQLRSTARVPVQNSTLFLRTRKILAGCFAGVGVRVHHEEGTEGTDRHAARGIYKHEHDLATNMTIKGLSNPSGPKELKKGSQRPMGRAPGSRAPPASLLGDTAAAARVMQSNMTAKPRTTNDTNWI